MVQSNRSRLENGVVWVIAWALVVLPLAWLAMLATGAWLDNRTSYWGWVLLTAISGLVGEGLRWLWRRFKRLVGRWRISRRERSGSRG